MPDAHAHRHLRTWDVPAGGRRRRRPPAADVEQRRRDLALPPDRGDELLLPERRGRRGDLRPRRLGHARDDLRRPAVQAGRLHRRPARHDLPLRAGRRAALPRLRDAGADHDPEALPQRARAADGARAVLPPRHPCADRVAHAPRPRRARREGARARRLPDLRDRLPPVRRRRLGRLRLSVDVLDPRLRADHRAHPHAAAVAPDVRRPELRHLLVLPAQARLRPRGGADPVPPLESAERGDDLLRRRQLLVAQGDRGRLGHAASVGSAARPAAGPRREVARDDRDARVRGDVRHVPSAEADDARRRPRRRQVHVLVGRETPRRTTRPASPRTSELLRSPSRTTSRSRRAASSRSAPTSRTASSTAFSTARSAAATSRSRRRRAASTSSRSTTRPAPSC